MSMFGVPGKCPRCNKTVYAAEQKLAEGKSWHNLCWALEFKEREAAKKAHKDETSYNKPADVTPAYYRVADVATGEPPRMESGGGQAVVAPGVNPGIPPSQAAYAAAELATPVAAATPKFCSECGRPRTPTDRFCGGCGKRLD